MPLHTTLPRSIKQISEAVDYLREALRPQVRPPGSGLNQMGDLLKALGS